MRVEGSTGRWLAAAVAALVAACVLLVPGIAGAREDDPVIILHEPGDGAVVKNAIHGLHVEFTCPAFHPYPQDVTEGPVEGYHVILADAPDVGPDGLLLVAHRVDERDAVAIDQPIPPTGEVPPALCTAAADDAGNGLRPPEPGRYWWQVYRDCVSPTCYPGVDVSDPSMVSVVRTACNVQRYLLRRAEHRLAGARHLLHRHHTRRRRELVRRYERRVTLLRARVRLVYHCARR